MTPCTGSPSGLLAAVEDAGAPELTGGKRIRDQLIAGLTVLADWYVQVERAPVEARTDDVAACADDMQRAP